MVELKLTLLLIVLVSVVYADLYRWGPSKSTDAAYPDHCYDPDTKAFYKPRAEYYNRVGKCQKMFCHADYSMEAHG